ncbi:MAG: DNA polymerase III subunit delta' [Acidobacteria bacterium]|nr:MAG: DNA polymerase III subunit delta' [Acidobacteriota bacterium]
MKDLIGNKTVAEKLSRLVEAGRLPNALLFAGPEGIGKKLFAFEVARLLVCTRREGSSACGLCSACKRAGELAMPKFEKGEESEQVFFTQHPDVGIVVPYKRNLRINSIRALEREAYFRPYESSARVFVIEDAEKMNDAASNALLKTLEEPPATTHLILIASREDTLLPTIRSRCQTIRFAPVPLADLERHLIDSCSFSPEDAALAARVSGGSVGRAMDIVPASFRNQRSAMLHVLSAAIKGNRRELLGASEEMNSAANKDEYEETLEILQGLVHDVWLIRNRANEVAILNTDIRNELAELAESSTSQSLAGWLEQIESLKENFIVNINKKIATDALFVGMAA